VSCGGFGKFVAAILIVMISALALRAEDEVDEYAVKAAYLFKLGNYVRWPANLPAQRYVIGVWGDNPSEQALAPFAAAKIGGAPATHARFSSLDKAPNCQIVFVAGEDDLAREHLRAAVAAFRGKPVLIIAEAPGGIEAGAAVNLVRAENTIKFDLNLAAANQAGLSFDARLHRIAHAVSGGDATLEK
jgi:uncharacterized protein DUF4154